MTALSKKWFIIAGLGDPSFFKEDGYAGQARA
jgi:hypothetical protein